jgi:hypothetical protein
MIKNITLLSLVSLFFVVGCGGGGGGGDAPESTNSSGFPDVAGRYSFNTSAIGVSCTDGSTATNPAIALNFDIVQTDNQITLVNTNAAGGIPGITIIDSTDASGNVQKNSKFITSQITTATIDGIAGTVSLNYNVSGTFTSTGWSGTYTFTATSGILGTCTFSSTFTGDKINVSVALRGAVLSPAYDLEGLPVDIYDSFSKIAASLAITQ